MKILDYITLKIDKIILVFAIFVLLISVYFIYFLNNSYLQKETIQSLDNALLLTRNILEEEQQHALSLSLLLCEDKSFLDAYFRDDRKGAFTILNEKIKSLKKLQGYTFDVQVHDQNLHTYLRSWNFMIKDVPLASFREGLVLVKKRLKPLVSIEVGKRLNIKAISPIIKNGKFAGSIEVIEGFDHLREKLAQQGYSLFIVLDKKFLSIATTLNKHLLLSNQYVLVNCLYEKKSCFALKNADLTKLGSYGYFTQNGYAFGYFEIKNFHNEKLGYCIIALQKHRSYSEQSYHSHIVIENNITGVVIR